MSKRVSKSKLSLTTATTPLTPEKIDNAAKFLRHASETFFANKGPLSQAKKEEISKNIMEKLPPLNSN